MYSIFRNLAIIILSAKFFGLVARKCKAPQVVGEILAGLVIGPRARCRRGSNSAGYNPPPRESGSFSTVSILREILMSRCIQNINAVTIIMKLQNRGSNGNTSLFFDLHPV